ncbi:amino acid-binding protein [Sporanaerobium hydrogeniformans]|uniref:Amino acid-binding protein n=1 Tax=Sporanaerobium hydrogeniformans TaxID=3072179 RepID=A0AC61DDE5_9FIRM|nr:ACT domain-containing protein [Sporanaerobium hydrogeniformans]PHV70607.1 amino acid-binding protein [Sporanaerobium hydrogeniformans]
MSNFKLTLQLLEGSYSVCKNYPLSDLQYLIEHSHFFSFTKTSDELSFVINSSALTDYPNVQYEKDWRILKVLGPLDFSLVGILSDLTTTLCKANISLFALSTFDTDYILVKENVINPAILALKKEGYEILPDLL